MLLLSYRVNLHVMHAGLTIKRRSNAVGYFAILSAIPGFFLSSFILMELWGVIAPNFDIKDIDYPMAMLITITAWLTVAPLVAVTNRRVRRWKRTE